MTVVVLALAIFALPSALNLPQANPGQTLEYAPVPGNQGAPAGGNFAGLGLGEAAGPIAPGLGQDQGGSQLYQLGLPGGSAPPADKQCVGTPARQTEDPLSPPCVAFYRGDNGGATYPGVTANEVRVLIYLDGGFTFIGSAKGTEKVPSDQLYDLWDAGSASDFVQVRALRLWQTYFNTRYQTYNRRVHFFAYFNTVEDQTTTLTLSPDRQRQYAAANYAQVKPFAVLNYSAYYSADYSAAMAQKRVLVFGGEALRSDTYYQTYAKLFWGFPPSVEREAAMFSSYVCSEVQPYGISFSGNTAQYGKQRVYGLLYADVPEAPDLKAMAMLVKQQVEGCGVVFADTKTTTYTGTGSTGVGNPGTAPPSQATVNMSHFQQSGVTTVIWPGGAEANSTTAAGRLNYYPEWIAADEGVFGTAMAASQEDPLEWRNAKLVTPMERMGRLGVPDACVDAVLSVDSTVQASDIRVYCYASNSAQDDFWDDLRQLFTGIQVSGPRLTPDAIDQGFRAIPPHSSSSPFTPACYYMLNDFTCVKDAQAQWWDPAGNNGSGSAGCWRMDESGRRYVAGKWPAGDVMTHQTGSDICNTR